KHFAAFIAERLKKRFQVFHAIVDHEGRLAWSDVVATRCLNGPGRSSLGRIAVGVGPIKGCTTPVLYVYAQVSLVPGTERLRILRAEEYATNSSYSLHLILRIEPDANGRHPTPNVSASPAALQDSRE